MGNKFLKCLNFGGEDNFYPLPIVTSADDGKVLKVVDGNWEVADLIPPVLINFTYGGSSYQAEEGMTWLDFIASDYNTADFRTLDNELHVIQNPYAYVMLDATTYVHPTDQIIDGYSYAFKYIAG